MTTNAIPALTMTSNWWRHCVRSPAECASCCAGHRFVIRGVPPFKSLLDPLEKMVLPHQDKHYLPQNDERHAGEKPHEAEKHGGASLFEKRRACEVPPRDINDEHK